MNKLLLLPITLVLFALVSFGVPAVAHAYTPAFATTSADACNKSGAILPTWYKYLEFDGNCDVIMDKDTLLKSIVLIAMAVIEMLLMLAGIIAVIMVMVGGFKYVVSQGEPDKISNAKNTIINSLVGAVIAIIASQTLAFVVGTFVNADAGAYGLFHVEASNGMLSNGLQVFFAVIGAVSVFMIVLAGFNFIVSGGNPEKVAKARRTILYAIIGLVVAIFASAIVSYVLKKVK